MAEGTERVTFDNLRIGAEVIRGPDWQWDDQDGGKGGIGIILDPSDPSNRLPSDLAQGWIKVRWGNGVVQNYRVGYRANHDLVYVKREATPQAWLDAQQERLWTERKFTDAEVVVGTSRFPAHRATLCAASPVFAAAFDSPMQEGATAKYTVDDAEPAAVEAMLHFFYTGKVSIPDAAAPDPAKIIELAVRYQVDGLVAAAGGKVLDGVTAQNARERASVLKRHADHASLDGKWAKFRKIVKK